MAFDTPAAVAGILFTLAFTQVGVDLVDAMSDGIWSADTRPRRSNAVDGLLLTAGKLPPGSFLTPLLLLIGMLAMLMLWIVLFVREALIYLVVALAPMAWATSVWPAIASVRRRVWSCSRRWCSRKLAIAMALAVGLGALGGFGATGNPGESTVDNGLAEFSTLVVGIITFGLAAFMPFLVIKLIPIVEAAVIAQGIQSAPMRAAQTGLAVLVLLPGHATGRLAGTGTGVGGAGLVAQTAGGQRATRPGDSQRRPVRVGSGAATVSTPPSRARTGSRRSSGPGCSDRCRPRRSSSSWSAAACRSSGILMRLFPWALLPALVAAVLAFKRVRGWPLHELIPLKVVVAAPPARNGGGSDRFRSLGLGEQVRRGRSRRACAGCELLDVESSWAASPGRLAGVGVVHDIERRPADRGAAGDRRRAVHVELGRGTGRPCGPVGRRARGVLPGASDRVPSRVAGVVDLDRRRGGVRADRLSAAEPLAMAAADYAELVTHAAPRAVEHDTLVSLTVDVAKVPDAPGPPGRRSGGRAADAARGAAAVHRTAGGRRPRRRSAPLTPAEITTGRPYPVEPVRRDPATRSCLDARCGPRGQRRRPGPDGGGRGLGARSCRSSGAPVVVGRGVAALRGAGGVDGHAAARR